MRNAVRASTDEENPAGVADALAHDASDAIEQPFVVGRGLGENLRRFGDHPQVFPNPHRL